MTLMKELESYAAVSSVYLAEPGMFEALEIWGSRTTALPINKESGTEMINKIKPEVIGLAISACVAIISMVAAFLSGYSILGWLFTIPLIGIVMCSGFIVYIARR